MHRAAIPAPEGPLLYVSDAGNNNVKFFTYPAGQLMGTLTGFEAVRGVCGDKTGNVYVVDAHKSEVVRYAHGQKGRSKVLYDQGYYPNGCAVDPLTGKLAVTLISETSAAGVLALFTHAAGRPVYYEIPSMWTPAYCGFDTKGNLYIDGTDKQGNFAFARMLAGYHNIYSLKLNQAIEVPGGVQWDGKYVAVGDRGVSSMGSTIYQFSMGTNAGTLQGTVQLDGSTDVMQFWIDGGTVIGPNSGSSPSVKFWPYPGGGSPTQGVGKFRDPIGAVVSPV